VRQRLPRDIGAIPSYDTAKEVHNYRWLQRLREWGAAGCRRPSQTRGDEHSWRAISGNRPCRHAGASGGYHELAEGVGRPNKAAIVSLWPTRIAYSAGLMPQWLTVGSAKWPCHFTGLPGPDLAVRSDGRLNGRNARIA